jgi:predicted metal-dependent peptidase
MVHEKIQAARLMLSQKWFYLSSAVWAMNVHEVPIEKMGGMPTMGVDKYWRLYYCVEFLNTVTTEEVAGLLYHEVLHLLRSHHQRAEFMGPIQGLANVAMDFEVNDNVIADGAKLPDGGCHAKDAGLPDGQLWEWYYRELEKLQPPQQPQPQPTGGSCADGKQREWEHGSPSEKGEDGTDNPAGVSQGRGESLKRKVAEDVKAAESRGDTPEHMKVWAGELLNPKVNWRTELRAIVRSAMQYVAGRHDYTYRRSCRRQSAFGRVIRPGMHTPAPQISVVVDTSGSMSGLMKEAMAEVQGIVKATGIGHIWVIPCDAVAGKPVQIQANGSIGKLQDVHGGGGTDMGKGIEAASDVRSDVCVVLTDCITPWNCAEPRFRVIVGGVDANESTIKSYPIPDYAKFIPINDD